jgi:hypothetical protein
MKRETVKLLVVLAALGAAVLLACFSVAHELTWAELDIGLLAVGCLL